MYYFVYCLRISNCVKQNKHIWRLSYCIGFESLGFLRYDFYNASVSQILYSLAIMAILDTNLTRPVWRYFLSTIFVSLIFVWSCFVDDSYHRQSLSYLLFKSLFKESPLKSEHCIIVLFSTLPLKHTWAYMTMSQLWNMIYN